MNGPRKNSETEANRGAKHCTGAEARANFAALAARLKVVPSYKAFAMGSFSAACGACILPTNNRARSQSVHLRRVPDRHNSCSGSRQDGRICGKIVGVTGSFDRRLRLALTLALCLAWAATPLIAQMCAITPTHCQRHMPCCPPSGSGSQNCSPSLCPAEASQRAVQTRIVVTAPPMRVAAAPARPATRAEVPFRELTCGLRYSPPVFRLKDDLRI